MEVVDDIIASNPIKTLLVDPTRLNIRVRSEVCERLSITSVDFDDMLCEENDIYCELNLPRCITYIIPADIDEIEMTDLADAIVDVATKLRQRLQEPQQLLSNVGSANTDKFAAVGNSSLLRYLSPYDLKSMQARSILRSDGRINEDLIGHCSCETVLSSLIFLCSPLFIMFLLSSAQISVYPPGIPLIVQDEVIAMHHLQELAAIGKSLSHNGDSSITSVLGSGRSIVGNKDPRLATIFTIARPT